MNVKDRGWTNWAIHRIESDFKRSADTHLIRLELPALKGINLYLKDESTHPTGSLKHRLARSLFLYGLVNGRIEEGTPVVESSSGNTAVSEAYFARLLGQIAQSASGHYLDQFTNAERVTDWRGNNNIAQSIFDQMQRECCPIPEWIVVSAGTGGTPATIGRYIRYRRHATRLCVADPEHSVFFDYWKTRDRTLTSEPMSIIEGIGRPRVEPLFVPEVIDHMIRVPDAASIATIRFLEGILGRKVGGSTGTNVYACFQLIDQLIAQGREGSLVTMLCDNGERYLNTYYNDEWLAEKDLDLGPWLGRLDEFLATGSLQEQ